MGKATYKNSAKQMCSKSK